MAVVLPTDTAYLRWETRQYELCNVPLGHGVSRRRLGLGVPVCLGWWVLLAVVGVDPWWALGPAVFVVPPFTVVFLGTAVGDDGRMRLVGWYDAVSARWPGRRRPLGNPLLPAGDGGVLRLRVVTELRANGRAPARPEPSPQADRDVS